ncbi:unnamed protein product [Durusdinium trenchii]|uniref:Uncharacterized protein n=1 Tax=Durusdinium trenchii TaxID=1381693 RepID=A0ABP0NHD2_9DINO
MTQAFDSWSQWLKRPVHGTLYGQALHTLQPPQGARGTVLVWLKNTADYVKTYKDNDQPMRLKKEYKNHWDSMCAIYFVYDTYQTLHTLQWMLDRQKVQRVHAQDFWATTMEVPKWFNRFNSMTLMDITTHFHGKARAVRERRGNCLVHQPGTRLWRVYVTLNQGGSFLSLSEEMVIEEDDLASIWSVVEEADEKELRQFIDEKAFTKIPLSDVIDDPNVVIIDGVWVRCWKIKLGKKIVKSRMYARGCFDTQPMELATRSATASRLSQRILMSTAAVMNEEPEVVAEAGHQDASKVSCGRTTSQVLATFGKGSNLERFLNTG